MGRGNDAIPSWSGFNYQGKVLLLCSIKKINELKKIGSCIDSYYVELEKNEDYSFVNEDSIENLFQVKATLSKSKWSDYDEALKKLLSHKVSAGNPLATCTLVVAKDIVDWDDALNPYQKSVNVFDYNSKVVEVNQVKECVISEIKEYLQIVSKSCKNEEAIYGQLCIFLDEKVAKMHLEGHKNREYKISFKEIVSQIDGALKMIDADANYIIKEQAYEFIVDTIKTSMNIMCKQGCKSDIENCNKMCVVKEAHMRILELPDLTTYCQIINPDKKVDENNHFSLISNISSSAIVNNILFVFKSSRDPQFVVSKDNMVGLESAKCKNPQGIIIPTLLSLNNPIVGKEESLQYIFQSIRENYEVYRRLLGNSIVADSNTFSGNISQAEISSAWTDYDGEKIDNYINDIEILSMRELIDWFDSEGGNHA